MKQEIEFITETKPLEDVLDAVKIIDLMLRSAVPHGQLTYVTFLDEVLKIV